MAPTFGLAVGGVRVFKPAWRSFFSSLGWSLSMAGVAGAMLYFGPSRWQLSLVILIFSGLMGLFSVVSVLQDIFVHLQKIILLPEGIAVQGILGRPHGVGWSNVKEASLRERHNMVSATDKLIVIITDRGPEVAYPVSILSQADQNEVLMAVRNAVPTVVRFDKGTL